MSNKEISKEQSKKKSKASKKIIILLLIIFIPLCIIGTILGIIGYQGMKKVQDVNKDTEIKSLIIDIQLELETYYEKNIGKYPESLETIKSDLLSRIGSSFENVSISGSTLSVEGYTIEYERINKKDYKISTTLKNGEVYEVTSN